MYSGSDSTGSQNLAQWAVKPAAYQNMSNDQVDWAALAQQWIIMKEAGPPPVITQEGPNLSHLARKEWLNEGGEAPMDVENDKDEPGLDNWCNQGENSDWSWNAQSQSWGWTNQWTAPTGVPPPIPLKAPLLPTPANYPYSSAPEPPNDNAGYTTGANNDYSSGYWTSSGGAAKQLKPHNRRFSKVNVPRPLQNSIPEPQPPPTLDAAKRKQLPAWIREGLEKMEREKQKHLEREKEKLQREEYNEKLKQSEKETMEILKSTMKERQKSKFDSDGDESEEEKKRKEPSAKVESVQLSAEEQMKNVRRTMTEILLKVTSHEIEAICREELQRYHKRNKASDQRVSAPSGANISAKLGLGIYGDSGSSSSEDEKDDDYSQEKHDSDSDLRDSIRRKKAAFSKTEKEIEDKLAEAENRKQEAASRATTPDTNDKDTQVDAKNQGGDRKQHSSSRSGRSKITKQTKSRSTSSASSTHSDDDKRKHTSERRSSTSSSGSRDNYNKNKRRRSRSGTLEKSRHNKSVKSSRRSRSRSSSRHRKESTRSRHARRSSRSNSRSRRSSSYGSRRRSKSRNRRSRSRRRSRSPYSKNNRRSRSRSRESRRRRSRSSSSGRGKKSRRR